MEKLNEVLIAFNKGQMKIEDIAWLIEEVQRLQEIVEDRTKDVIHQQKEIERLQVVEAAYKGMRLSK